jgi:uncharacterized glyoxalase superfamily protein PhnB
MTAAAISTSSPIHEVFACLRVGGAPEAIAFHQRAFGAAKRFRLVEPSGRVGHAEPQFGPAVVMLPDALPEYGLDAPAADTPLCVSVLLHVHDAGALAARAGAEGAELLTPPTNQFYCKSS